MDYFSDRHNSLTGCILCATSRKERDMFAQQQQDNLKVWGDYIIATGNREATRQQVADWCDSQAVAK